MQDPSSDPATDDSTSDRGGFSFEASPQHANKPPVPESNRPAPLVWEEQPVVGFGGHVEVLQHSRDLVAKVLDGADYLVATARTTYTPPARYQFGRWPPLQTGRLTFRSGDPQFSPYWLGRVLASLADGHRYHPDRYTVYYRGSAPLYIEGPSGGIVLAPW